MLPGDAGHFDHAVACFGGHQPANEKVRADRDIAQCFNIAPHGQFEGCAAAGDEGQLLVLRQGLVACLLGRGQQVVECQFTDAECLPTLTCL